MTLISGLLLLLVMMRFGLIATFFTFCIDQIFRNYPITFQTSAWYAGAGYAAFLVILAVSVYGFHTSLGGRRIFDLSSVD